MSQENHIDTSDLRERHHAFCFACSSSNPLGLKLEYTDLNDDTLTSTFVLSEEYQGFNNVIHGGIVVTILDSSMNSLLLHKDILAMTVKLNTRFKRPLIPNISAVVAAKMIKARSPLFDLRSEIRQQGRLVARAEGQFMKPDKGNSFFEENRTIMFGC